jgi:molybdopterin synthase sulfur carrier subunit
VKVLYFAWVRQKIGRGEETIELPESVRTVGQLAEYLCARGGGYAEAFVDLSRMRAAVNQEHANLDAHLSSNDEVAFFPPVTGG